MLYKTLISMDGQHKIGNSSWGGGVVGAISQQ